jgi:hypothetical protein
VSRLIENERRSPLMPRMSSVAAAAQTVQVAWCSLMPSERAPSTTWSRAAISEPAGHQLLTLARLDPDRSTDKGRM